MLGHVKQGEKLTEKLNRAQKCSISGPQNLGFGDLGPQGHLDLLVAVHGPK